MTACAFSPIWFVWHYYLARDNYNIITNVSTRTAEKKNSLSIFVIVSFASADAYPPVIGGRQGVKSHARPRFESASRRERKTAGGVNVVTFKRQIVNRGNGERLQKVEQSPKITGRSRGARCRFHDKKISSRRIYAGTIVRGVWAYGVGGRVVVSEHDRLSRKYGEVRRVTNEELIYSMPRYERQMTLRATGIRDINWHLADYSRLPAALFIAPR